MSTNDLFDRQAELGSESDDEDYNGEENGEGDERPRKSNGAGYDDSSEEEEDDDDAEAAAEIQEGFIADDDEEEEEEREARRARRAERKKRKREERQDENDNLDEEDLDLILDNNPDLAAARQAEQKSSSKKFKRLKRGRNDQDTAADTQDDFWGDQEEAVRPGRLDDEMDGFIEEDYPEDEVDAEIQEYDEIRRGVSTALLNMQETAGLDEEALEDFRKAFGDGTDYDWALALDEEEDANRTGGRDADGGALSKPIELRDVFEPSELDRKFLSDKDAIIRATDEPERFQLAREPYKDLVLTDEQTEEEAVWISNLLWAEKRFNQELFEPFKKAVAKTLEFFNGEELEVPFIFRHRKDHLIFEQSVPAETQQSSDETSPTALERVGVKLLIERDLWEIFYQDLKFRALIEKRGALQKTYISLQEAAPFQDLIFEEMIVKAETVEELQDIQEYLHFQHSSRLADMQSANAVYRLNGSARPHKRPGANKLLFEKVRNSSVYGLVRAYGTTADAFASNVLRNMGDDSIGSRQYTDDPSRLPEDLAQSEDILSPPDFPSPSQCLRAARQMFAEELIMSPRLRLVMRRRWYMTAAFDCIRTPKGLAKIDSQHPFYDLKYLRSQRLKDFLESPGLFLRMLRAEQEGLIEVKARLSDFDDFKKELYRELESDNLSDIADAWNRERREALNLALERLNMMMARSVKATMKAKCEDLVADRCRESFYDKLDQAPFRPPGEKNGTVPRVLAISNGNGVYGKDPVTYVFVEDDGRMLESGHLTDLGLAIPEKGIPEGKDVKTLEDICERRSPDAIAISGWSTETLKLYRQIQKIIQEKDIQGPSFTEDDDDDNVNQDEDRRRSEPQQAFIVNDEVARMYKDSERASKDYPSLTSLGRYCVGIARYMQSPLLEYANLKEDIAALTFDADQRYISKERLLQALETAMIDVVNMVGVDINEAMENDYIAALLPYVAGLGHRKTLALQKAVRLNGNNVVARRELVGDAETGKVQAVGIRTYMNCASFLRIIYDTEDDNREADPLDDTRIHPQDYDIARKMAADALELDEEDIDQEVTDHGDGAIVRKLIKDGKRTNVEDLILEEYAEQLWERFHQRKRSTLQMIRSELLDEFEELRQKFDDNLRTDVIFTMLTGETRDSLEEGMIVPMSIRKVGDDTIEGRLDCGIDAIVEAGHISEDAGRSARQMFAPHTTVQAKILRLDKRQMHARLTMLDSELRRGYERRLDWGPGEWDDAQERLDQDTMKKKDTAVQRQQRVIKHPNFKPFNATQAEEFLGSQAIGEVVIRPSSKGLDHLVVTWKVAEGIYKHIDVLELDKENEFSLGRTLKVDGRSYSDLDELIQSHIKAMNRKVDEMMLHEKYQRGSKADTEGWLSTYLEANPGRSMYAFCINSKAPGYFHLCFKTNQSSPLQDWIVKVIPGAYELQRHQYSDMTALCNGFKTLFKNALPGRSMVRR